VLTMETRWNRVAGIAVNANSGRGPTSVLVKFRQQK
jgi:hypothetical protein